jgi:hypothetical protein
MVKKQVVEYVECPVCGVYYPETDVCPVCKDKEEDVDMSVVDEIVTAWKGYKGKVTPAMIPVVDVDEDVAKAAYDQVGTFQGKVAVKATYQGKECGKCHKPMKGHDMTVVHVVDWHGAPGYVKYQHGGWDDIAVVCRKCADEICDTRPKGKW